MLIYRFRGANIENILSFEKQYAGARTIRLEQNYRSTQNILDAANAVIRHNVGRYAESQWIFESTDYFSAGHDMGEINSTTGINV